MVINFKTSENNQSTHKLIQISIVIKKKKHNLVSSIRFVLKGNMNFQNKRYHVSKQAPSDEERKDSVVSLL